MATVVGNENLRDLWNELSASRGDHLFLTCENRAGHRRSFTYGEFDRLVNRTANFLLTVGVRQGDNVAIQLYNSPEYVSATFALAKIGAVAVPINMQLVFDECAFQFDRCGIRTVICEPDCLGYYFAEAAPPCPNNTCEERRIYPMERVLVAHSGGDGLVAGAVDFDAGASACGDALDDPCALDGQDTAMIIFTSGTTSCPKGVEITHANMLFAGYYGDWQCALGPDDRMLTTMPAFHSNFQLAALMPVLTAGASLVVLEKYSARNFWRQVREHGATAIQMVAMMARTLMMQPVDAAEHEHRVRSVQYYLPIGDEEKEAFERRFSVRLQNCYGATESICWALTDLPCGPRRWPSVGRAGLGYEVEILDEAGHPAAPGTVGEIAVKGIPGISLMKGYYDDPEATARTVSEEGWYLSGDKGYRDEEGWFYFVDRKCNMIKRGGENVSATEVEEVLSAHPAVAECAVIGVDDPVRDQAVKAFVVLGQGQAASVEEITRFAACRLADFKVPTIMEIVGELPHTSVGKVEKKLLCSLD
ncbi:MAG: crotonobetaine/carnitine-CoA ligase [Adlercreutzia equolifaciens]|nr:crotonobetaine/carnitine-CoA ligase [Adlercreutzia equolifaciens]